VFGRALENLKGVNGVLLYYRLFSTATKSRHKVLSHSRIVEVEIMIHEIIERKEECGVSGHDWFV
jgi:hypothetical protein